ncbi:MAG: response regulator [Planctomycetota bacterium]|jgi:putative two-component system response regulator|nr:response regulator [Planctomycetota bacterium]
MSEGTVLIVEDSVIIRRLIRDQVRKLGYEPREAENGAEALKDMRVKHPDCVILDLMMPVMSGPELLEIMQNDPVMREVPVIVVTALSDMDKIVYCIEHGAADYMPKPFRAQVLRARLSACIDRKKSHDREIALQRQLEQQNAHLEERVKEQVKQITAAQLGTIFAMCKLAESRDFDTGEHLERVREFCSVLATAMRKRPNPEEEPLTGEFLENIRIAAPLHDIGKVAVSDLILQKPGKLTVEEFEMMKKHTTIGYNLLADVDHLHPDNNFIRMGMEIALAHHEKWDGTGYPNGLAGYGIPVSARIMALADVYDALSHQRCYKPALSHEESMTIIGEGRAKHFDPYLTDLFFDLQDKLLDIAVQFDGKPEVMPRIVKPAAV